MLEQFLIVIKYEIKMLQTIYAIFLMNKVNKTKPMKKVDEMLFLMFYGSMSKLMLSLSKKLVN